MSKQPMDLNDVEGINAAMDAAAMDAAAMAIPTEATPKAPKVKKPRVLKITCPDCGKEFDFEIPVGQHIVGQNAGIALADMDESQLRIEYRNSNSVFFKTKKRTTATPEQIAKAEARVAAVKEAMDAKGIKLTSRATVELDAAGIAALINSGKIKLEDLNSLLA